jgi:hypothetical protein
MALAQLMIKRAVVVELRSSHSIIELAIAKAKYPARVLTWLWLEP